MVLLVFSAVVGGIVNQMGMRWLNLIIRTVILCVYICQYERGIKLKGIAVMIYTGLMVIVEPIGYILYSVFMKKYHYDEDILYCIIVFCMELFSVIVV